MTSKYRLLILEADTRGSKETTDVNTSNEVEAADEMFISTFISSECQISQLCNSSVNLVTVYLAIYTEQTCVTVCTNSPELTALMVHLHYVQRQKNRHLFTLCYILQTVGNNEISL